MLIVDEETGILFGDKDGETDGLFGILGGVVYGPISAPRSEQNAVGENDRDGVLSALGRDGLHAGTETFYGGRTIDVASHIPMARLHGVLDGEVEAVFGFACLEV